MPPTVVLSSSMRSTCMISPWALKAWLALVGHQLVHVALAHEAALNLAHDDGAHVPPLVHDGQAHRGQGVGVGGLDAIQDLHTGKPGRQAGSQPSSQAM
eukprot:1146622-Pelagomonas_calceolata.AAC.4